MAYSLAEVRAALARAMGRLVEGTATGGGLTTIVDTEGLAIRVNAEELERGIAYIRAADDESPEGEARWVEDYTVGTSTLTVATAFSAAVGAGDSYEVYLAPLSLEEWNECINQAIREAWPEVCEVGRGSPTWLPPSSECALEEWERHVLTVMMTGEAGASEDQQPVLRVPRSWWEVVSTGDGTWALQVNHVLPAELALLIVYRKRYEELTDWLPGEAPPPGEGEEAGPDETELALSYLIPAARANVHALLAERAGAQATAAQHLQLLNYWREQAQNQKERLVMLVEEVRA